MKKPSLNKKSILTIALVGLLVLAGYGNYWINANADKVATWGLRSTAAPQPSASPQAAQVGDQSSQQTGSFFTSYKLERNQVRQEEISYLDAIIQSTDSDSPSIEDALAQKLALTVAMEKETIVEGLLKAKGFADVVVTIQEGSVNVIVKQQELTDAQVAQILEVARTESGEPAENIKVIPSIA